MKVLVTGGGGFIGSNLVRGLLARGDTVRVLDNFATSKRKNLEEVRHDIELIEGDIRDPSVCRATCQGMEGVLHQAAVGSVPLSIEDPLTSHQVNVDGTVNMLLAAREMGVRRFLFASSSSVYGDAPERVKIETLPARTQSPYAVSKLAGEAYTLVFSRVYSLETIALRYFNIFGPRQSPDSMYAAVIPKFASCLIAGKSPTIYGDGGQTRDFTFVENVVQANLLGLDALSSACGKAYNIACGATTSLNELYRMIQEQIGGRTSQIRPEYAPARKGDVRDSLASIAAAKEALGYVPNIDVNEGIRRTTAWYLAQESSR